MNFNWFSCGSSILVELESGDFGFGGRRKTGETGEKPSNKQRTYLWNRTRATLVGGERSHHCAIPVFHLI